MWLITIIFGIAVTIAILLFGKTSGAHINPAVSFAFYLNKSLTYTELIFYTISQCMGAILGAYLFDIVYPSEYVGTTLPSVNIPLAFLFEIVGLHLGAESAKAASAHLTVLFIVHIFRTFRTLSI